MSVRAAISADLEFSVSLPGREHYRTVSGTLRGHDSDLELCVDELHLLGNIRALRGQSVALAAALARHDVRLTITDDSGPVVAIGAVDAGWLQRVFTGSRHIRVHGLRVLRVRRRLRQHAPSDAGDVPLRFLVPALPSLGVLPMAPTVLHPRHRPVTRTHDAPGGGDPHLTFALGPHPWPGDQPRTFPLRSELTTIGSGPDADLRLPGIAPRHAEIRHDEDDEYILVEHHASDGTAQVPRETVLRTGCRLEFGEWTLSYQRAEWADHGRPYGGRAGGELGYQRPQPPRQRRAPASESSRDTVRPDTR